MPIDFSSLLFGYMEVEPLRGKLPYGMALTLLFKYAGINLQCERYRRPSGKGFSPYSLAQAGMIFNPNTRSWSWNGKIVASPSINPLTSDYALLASIYKTKPQTRSSRKRTRSLRDISGSPTAMPDPTHTEPETSTRPDQNELMKKIDFLMNASTKILHQNASAKKARAAILEQNRFLYTSLAEKGLVDSPPTNLFDFAESEEDESESQAPSIRNENSE
jgi:hypothetical protein